MREILFRGQTRRHGEKVRMDGEKVPSQWVYGGVFQGIADFSVIYGYDNPEMKGEFQKWTVYSDTLGQYTGLTDKNGKRIFEGDIVRYGFLYDYNCYLESLDYPEDYEGCDFSNDIKITTVKWYGEDGYPAFDLENHDFESNGLSHIGADGDYVLEVIGNIHDNPEMIGGAEYGKQNA